GKTKLTVTPAKGSGNTYKIKTATVIQAPSIGDDLTTWLDWNGTDEIEAATNNKICVAEVNNLKIVALAGKADVLSKA
ncbi:MAG: phage major capsid protein, partial [Eubacterium sp.]